MEREMDTKKKQRRDRMVHAALGPGVLIWESGMDMCFQPDDGKPWNFKWAALETGTPDYVKRSKRRKNLEMTTEEEKWMTIQTQTGETIALRKEDPKPTPTTEG
jgi:hypothetical protein